MISLFTMPENEIVAKSVQSTTMRGMHPRASWKLRYLRAIQVLRNGAGGQLSRKKALYEGVRFNVISVTRGWVGVKFFGKKALRNT